MTDPRREVIARALAEHQIDWPIAETGLYPCKSEDGFATDVPKAWDLHVADAVLVALGEELEPEYEQIGYRKKYGHGWGAVIVASRLGDLTEAVFVKRSAS